MAESTLRSAAALWRFWWMRGAVAEGRRWYELARPRTRCGCERGSKSAAAVGRRLTPTLSRGTLRARWIVSERLSGTVTFLFTDIEGSTKLLKALGRERYGQVLADQQQLLREAFAAHNGEEVDTQGDSFFVAFRGAGDALRAAVAIELALADHTWREGARVRVRIGIHSGEAAGAAGRYVGFSVHRAARVGAVAHGGQVLVSESTRALVEDDLPAGMFLRDLGRYRLKDIERPERISQVAAEGLQAEFPPLRGAERVREPVFQHRSILAAAARRCAGSRGRDASIRAQRAAARKLADVGGAPGRTPSRRSTHRAAARRARSPSRRRRAIAYGEGSVWVTMPNQDSVSRIDPTTNTVQQTIAVGNGPTGIAVGRRLRLGREQPRRHGLADRPADERRPGRRQDRRRKRPDGGRVRARRVWVANSVDRTVERIDPLTGKPGQADPGRRRRGRDRRRRRRRLGDGQVRRRPLPHRPSLRERRPRSTSATGRPRSPPARGRCGSQTAWTRRSGGSIRRRTGSWARSRSARGRAASPSRPAGTSSGSRTRSPARSRRSTRRPARSSRASRSATSRRESPRARARAYVAVRGSAGGAHRGGTLTLAVPNLPDSYAGGLVQALDPATGVAAGSSLTLTNDGLLGYGRSGGAEGYRVVPDLAVALPTVSDGGRTYTFQLRPGIRYSTGAVVRPEDVRRGIERTLLASGARQLLLRPGSSARRGCVAAPERCDLSKGIVTVPGSNTVIFHLTAPDPDFLYKLALPDADAVPASTPLEAHVPLPATGPYEIARIDAKRGVIRLVRNPRFHLWSAAAQPDGFPDRIVERYGYTGASAVRAVEAGRPTSPRTASSETWSPALASSLRTRVLEPPLQHAAIPSTTAVWLNTRLPPFDDVRVRQALNYAVDRNHLIELAGGPAVAQVGCQMLPPNIDGYRPLLPLHAPPGRRRNLQRARPREGAATRGGIRHERATGHRLVLRHPDRPRLERLLRLGAPKPRLQRALQAGPDGRDRPDLASDRGRPAPPASARSRRPTTPSRRSSHAAPTYAIHARTATTPSSATGASTPRSARRPHLQITDPTAASQLWTKIDRELTDLAPWVVMNVARNPDFVSRRTGNYTSCYLYSWLGLDQRLPRPALGALKREQPELRFGDHLDGGAVGHLYGGLIVNRVTRHGQAGGPFF